MREPEVKTPDVDSRKTSEGARGDRLHVVMILPTYLPESFGGAEQQCRKLSHALSRLGVEVTILAPRLLATTPRVEQDGEVSIRRFRVRNAPNLGGRYAGSLLLWSAGVLGWLWAHRSTVDVVHIFHGRLHALPGVLAGAVIGKPSLVKIGRGGEHFDLSLVRRKRVAGLRAYRALLKHTSGYIANSREIVDDLLAHGVPPDRIFAVPNGVEIPHVGSDAESSPTTPAARREYVCLGRLDPEKRIDLMLKGFARFSDRSARLTIVGEGECRAQLELLSSELGLGHRVRFSGRTEDVSKYLLAAHFYLSTSVSEGMSNALLEAMSFGLVPLVSNVSGANDIVDHGRTGFLFERDDLDDFMAKLELIGSTMPTGYRAVSNAARNTIRQSFAIEQIAEQHLHIYRSVIEIGRLPALSATRPIQGVSVFSSPGSHLSLEKCDGSSDHHQLL
jgi:glycosyltransferase involved in cell wall biosynthesis